MFCVAMGGGVMVSTGCLVLIPEVRFGLYHSYHPKCRRLSDSHNEAATLPASFMFCVAMGAGVMVITGCLVLIPK